MKATEYDFQPIKKIMDVRFGKIELNFDRKTGAHYSCKEYFLQSEAQETKLVENLNKRVLAPNLYYVPIANYKVDHFNQFCSRITKLRLYMPIPDEDLKKEIKKRVDRKSPFTNMELTFLLYDMVFGMAHLEDIDIPHGRLAPEWVALTTTGYAIIEDPVFFEMGYNGFYDLKSRKDFYLAPEVYEKSAMLQPLAPNHDYQKSDVFSAGLIMLEAGNLRRIKGIYKSGRFNRQRLKKLLQRFKTRYPDNNLLYSTVKKMVELDPVKRPTFGEIRSKLPDYKLVKDHFLENEDSAPVEDDYGYDYESSMRYYNTTTSDIRTPEPRKSQNNFDKSFKAKRLGFANGMSRRPKTPQKGSGKLDGKRATTPNIAHDNRFMDDVKMHTPQRRSFTIGSKLGHSPIQKQYGFSSTPKHSEFNLNQRRHTMDPSANFRNEYSPRPSQPTQNNINVDRRFSTGPNPQIGTKKPFNRRPSNLAEPLNRVIQNQDTGVSPPPMVKVMEEEDVTFTPDKPKYMNETGHTPVKQSVRNGCNIYLGVEDAE